MKHFLLAMAMLLPLSLGARDRLYIEDFQIQSGNTFELPILLDNDTTYCAFQTDLYLPEGLEVDMDGNEYIIDLTSRVPSRTHVVSSSLLEDGGIRIFVSSQSVKPISGNSGAVLTVLIKASTTLTNAPIELCNSMTVEENGQKHELDNCIAYANPSQNPVVVGDINDDGHVDISDVNAVINMMLGKTALTSAGDVNSDGKVDISDVNAIINLMLGKI